MTIDFSKIVNERKEEILKTLSELIKIRSVYDETTITKETPFGKGINDALEYMLSTAKSDGFEIAQDGGYAGSPAGKGEVRSSCGWQGAPPVRLDTKRCGQYVWSSLREAAAYCGCLPAAGSCPS